MDEPIGSNVIVNSWALAPASTNGDKNRPSERPFLTYNVQPGDVINDAVVLFNYSNVALTFRLYSTDAFNNEDGGFDVLAADKAPVDVGRWVTLGQETISLPPKSQARVPVTIRIPDKARPGDHVGAILASSEAVGQGPDGKVVNVDRRTGSRLYVRVAGRLTPALAITKISNTYHPSLNPLSGRSEVIYTVENRGNVRLAGRHRVQVEALLGLGKKASAFRDLPELLPGQDVTLSVSFGGQIATVLHSASVTIDPADADGQVLAAQSQRTRTLAVPWTLVALVTVGALIRYARRSYRRHQDIAAMSPVSPVNA